MRFKLRFYHLPSAAGTPLFMFLAKKNAKKDQYKISLETYAGRRTDFRDKKSRDFSGEIFLERNYCPRTDFSGSNP